MKLTQKVFIKFNSQIELADNFTDYIEYEIDEEKIEVLKFKVTNSDKIEIDLNLTESYQDAGFSIRLKNRDNIDSIDEPLIFNTNNNSIFTDFPIEVPISIYLDPNANIGSSASKVGSASILALSGPLILSNPVAMVSLVRLI